MDPSAEAPWPAITSFPAYKGGRQDCATGFGQAHTAAGWLYVPESWWRLASQEQVTGRGWPPLRGAEAGPDRDRAAPRPACPVTCRPGSRGGGWRFLLTLRNWPVPGETRTAAVLHDWASPKAAGRSRTEHVILRCGRLPVFAGAADLRSRPIRQFRPAWDGLEGRLAIGYSCG